MQTVHVIFDPFFGEQLRLLDSRPVWIVMSPANEPVVRASWAANPQPDHTRGVTGFTYNEQTSPEESLLSDLDTIDLHHGPYSTKDPYCVLEVIGAHLNDAIRSALSELGFVNFEAKEQGFTAARSLDEARKLRR